MFMAVAPHIESAFERLGFNFNQNNYTSFHNDI